MKNKDKQNKSIEDLTYDILGNAFVGNLFDISNDIDNTSQNLVAYLELEDIKKLSKKYNKKEKIILEMIVKCKELGYNIRESKVLIEEFFEL